MNTLQKIGEQFRMRRAELRLTLSQLASKSNVSEPTIRSLEHGSKDVSLSKIDQIAKVLDVDIDIKVKPKIYGL